MEPSLIRTELIISPFRSSLKLLYYNHSEETCIIKALKWMATISQVYHLHSFLDILHHRPLCTTSWSFFFPKLITWYFQCERLVAVSPVDITLPAVSCMSRCWSAGGGASLLCCSWVTRPLDLLTFFFFLTGSSYGKVPGSVWFHYLSKINTTVTNCIF